MSVIAILVLHGCTENPGSPSTATPPAVVAPRAATSSRATAEAEGLRVSVLALQVADEPHLAGDEEIRAVGALRSRTSVDLLVVDGDGRLLGVVAEQTHLELQDETGEAVRRREPPSQHGAHPPSGLNQMATVSEDRTAMRVGFSALGTPAPGARELRLRGVMGVAVGGARVAATGAVALREGEELTLGDVVLIVREIRPDEREPGSLIVRFGVPAGLAALDSLEDLRATSDGQPIQLQVRGRSISASGADSTLAVEYVLDRTDVSRLELSASYATERRVIAVPLDLTFGAGL